MSIRTNYEKWYEGEEYYWGLEPGEFLDELIRLCPPSNEKKVLDIGCGEMFRSLPILMDGTTEKK